MRIDQFCTLIGNAVGTGGAGGGAYGSEMDRCMIIGNTATNGDGYGGGVSFCTVNNSLLTGNLSCVNGGGAMYGTLNNCTIVANSAAVSGGGAGDSDMNNCIIYYNMAPAAENYVLDGEISGTLNYCCIAQSLGIGTGNITNEPQLADIAHISATSPCRGAGSTNYSTGLDIDGEPWLNPPSIGCDEFYPAGITGSLSVGSQANYTNVATQFTVDFIGTIDGHASYNVWDFGDGTLVSNRLYLSHTWTAGGNYPVTLTAYNQDNPEGVSATTMLIVLQNPMHHVALDSVNPVAPYLSWDTAATNIQDAVDTAFAGGTVLVTNGIYQNGGRVVYGLLTNRVAVTKPIMVQSANGPAVTFIQGYQDTNSIVADDAVRCVYLTNNAVLSGFTLTNGATRADGDENLEQSGGGILCDSTNAVVTNCVLIGNAANNAGGGANQGTFNQCLFVGNAVGNSSGGYGGGANNCLLNNCVLTNNVAGAVSAPAARVPVGRNPKPLVIVSVFGGGAENSTLNNCKLFNNIAQLGGGVDSSTANNCLLISNNASFGGGASSSSLNNCTVAGNGAGNWGGGVDQCTLNNCIDYYNSPPDGYSSYNYCCIPSDPGGPGNITNRPEFVNWTNNDFHLRSNSPCINSGDNSYISLTNDLDGNPRFVGLTVDLGPYEFQSPLSVLSYAWAQQYGLPTDGSVDYADLDGTGMNDWQKWIAGLDPTNAASVLAMLPPLATNNAMGVTVSWQSVSNRTYYLQSSTNLEAQPAFLTIQSNIAGQAGTTSYTDPTATSAGPYFYRVGVQ